jgi:hypothetical protein
MDRKSGTSIFAKSFTRPYFPSIFPLGTSNEFGVRFSGGYCPEERLRGVQNGCTWVLNTPGLFQSVHQSMHRRPKLVWQRKASIVTLTAIVTSCAWNVKLHLWLIVSLIFKQNSCVNDNVFLTNV